MYTRTDNPLHIIQEVLDNAADEALAGSVPLADLRAVHLVSDGITRAIDRLGLHTEEDAEHNGLVHAGNELTDRLAVVRDLAVRVLTHWLDRGASAWRLDAAYAVDPADHDAQVDYRTFMPLVARPAQQVVRGMLAHMDRPA